MEAIRLSSLDKLGATALQCDEPSNAMVFRIVRNGYLYYFDGETVVFLGRTEPPSMTEIGTTPEPGEVLNVFKEKEQLQGILLTPDCDSFMVLPSETVRVIARFCI